MSLGLLLILMEFAMTCLICMLTFCHLEWLPVCLIEIHITPNRMYSTNDDKDGKNQFRACPDQMPHS